MLDTGSDTMKSYRYLAGYKRRSRLYRDDLKDLLSISGDSKSRYNARFNSGYCEMYPVDQRGRCIHPKNIRVKMKIRAANLLD